MAQNISLMNAQYPDVPAIDLPKTGGGTARFHDTTDATASASEILSGYSAYGSGGKVNGNVVIQHYYTGTTVPSSSLGVNGDVYLKTT